uniref:Putative ovule protein n=1 Tax=Solanum chacoense TaxID=4108 RepID=A0A0V0H4D2_SOLCH
MAYVQHHGRAFFICFDNRHHMLIALVSDCVQKILAPCQFPHSLYFDSDHHIHQSQYKVWFFIAALHG